MATHVKVIAVLFLLFGTAFVALALFAPLLMNLLAGFVGSADDADAATAAAALGFTGLAVGAILLLIAIPYIVCGVGLFKRRNWARLLGILLAAIAVIRFPIGTVFGVYALVILIRKDTAALFTA